MGNSAFTVSMSANLIDFPPGRKKQWPSLGCPAPGGGSRYSRRSRLSSAVTSPSAARRRVDSAPIPAPADPAHQRRQPDPQITAISRCVRPLVCTRRTASSSNSFVNRRCCIIEFLISHEEHSTFPKQVHSTNLPNQNEPNSESRTIPVSSLAVAQSAKFETTPARRRSEPWPTGPGSSSFRIASAMSS